MHKTKGNILAQVIELIKDEKMIKVEIFDYNQIFPMKSIYTCEKFERNFTYMERWYNDIDQDRLAYEHEGIVFAS